MRAPELEPREADIGARRWLGAALVVVALALAAFLAVLGADVLAWRGQLEDADVGFTQRAGDPAMWEPDHRLPGSLARRALSVEDDIAYRRAVQRFRLSRPRSPQRDLNDVALRSAAETELARAGRAQSDRRRRSQLANLRGALAFEEARSDEAQAALFLRRGLGEFREAARLDPDNEDARYNLELVLRLLQNVEGESGGGGGGQRSDTPASGAGAASQGEGY